METVRLDKSKPTYQVMVLIDNNETSPHTGWNIVKTGYKRTGDGSLLVKKVAINHAKRIAENGYLWCIVIGKQPITKVIVVENKVIEPLTSERTKVWECEVEKK